MPGSRPIIAPGWNNDTHSNCWSSLLCALLGHRLCQANAKTTGHGEKQWVMLVVHAIGQQIVVIETKLFFEDEQPFFHKDLLRVYSGAGVMTPPQHVGNMDPWLLVGGALSLIQSTTERIQKGETRITQLHLFLSSSVICIQRGAVDNHSLKLIQMPFWSCLAQTCQRHPYGSQTPALSDCQGEKRRGRRESE